MTFAADRHLNGSSLASEANAITDDILDGAAEHFFGAGDRAFFGGGHADTPGLRTCFEVRIGDDFVNKSCQINGGCRGRMASTLDARQREKLTDQIVEAPGLQRDAIQKLGYFLRVCPSR